MSKEYNFIPYKSIGEFIFGEERNKVISIAGKIESSTMYGYPVENRFLDNFGYCHTLCNSNGLLEAIELFPDISSEELFINFNGVRILLSTNPDELVKEINKITDDLQWVDDEEGYSSMKLGLKIYCPDEVVEDVIIHDEHCYDEENEYIESNQL